MALSNLHTSSSYEEDRNQFIKDKENAALYASLNKNMLVDLNAHFEGESMAFGYGYDLWQNINSLKTDLSPYVSAVKNGVSVDTALQDVYNLILDNTEINKSGKRVYKNNAAYPNITSPYALATAINGLITLSTEANATALLNAKIQKYETSLSSVLGNDDLPQSQERAAIISLLYNLTNGTTISIRDTIPSTISAIQADNRAEAWYQIRYNSNGGDSRNTVGLGIANRRVGESDLFNLYGSGTLDEAEAKTIMRMYTLHKGDTNTAHTILGEENAFKAAYSGSNSITSQIKPAKDYLVEKFGEDIDINGEVIIGKGLDSYDYKEKGINPHNDKDLKGTDKNDIIFGEKGDDTIKAGSGDDIIYAGHGVNTVIGGMGNDIYIYQKGENGHGEGTLTIDDKSFGTDSNKLILKGYNFEEVNFAKSKDGKDLLISFEGKMGSVTVKDYDTFQGRVESFQFDDKTLSMIDIELELAKDKSLEELIQEDLGYTSEQFNELKATMNNIDYDTSMREDFKSLGWTDEQYDELSDAIKNDKHHPLVDSVRTDEQLAGLTPTTNTEINNTKDEEEDNVRRQ